MLAELEDRILAAWDTGRLGPRPRSLRYVGVAGRVEGGTTTLLVFADRGERPALAAKIHRHDDGGAGMRAEAAILERLARRSDLSGSVPAVLLADRIAGSWVLVQTALAGRPMIASGAGPGREAPLVLGWLERLHRERSPLPADEARRRARAVLDELAATFEIDGPTRALIASLDPANVAARGAFVVHGDLTPHNVLVRDGGIAVIDWTDARLDGFALEDAVLFLTAALVMRGAAARGRTLADAFARRYLDPGPDRDELLGHLRRHAVALGIEADALPTLICMSLVATAVSEARKLRAASERGSWPFYALHAAAAEHLDMSRITETVPWIGFVRAVASRGLGALA